MPYNINIHNIYKVKNVAQPNMPYADTVLRDNEVARWVIDVEGKLRSIGLKWTSFFIFWCLFIVHGITLDILQLVLKSGEITKYGFLTSLGSIL